MISRSENLLSQHPSRGTGEKQTKLSQPFERLIFDLLLSSHSDEIGPDDVLTHYFHNEKQFEHFMVKFLSKLLSICCPHLHFLIVTQQMISTDEFDGGKVGYIDITILRSINELTDDQWSAVTNFIAKPTVGQSLELVSLIKTNGIGFVSLELKYDFESLTPSALGKLVAGLTQNYIYCKSTPLPCIFPLAPVFTPSGIVESGATSLTRARNMQMLAQLYSVPLQNIVFSMDISYFSRFHRSVLKFNPLVSAFQQVWPDQIEVADLRKPLKVGSTCWVLRTQSKAYKLSFNAGEMQEEYNRSKRMQDLFDTHSTKPLSDIENTLLGQPWKAFFATDGEVISSCSTFSNVKQLCVSKGECSVHPVKLDGRVTKVLFSLRSVISRFSIDDQNEFLANIAMRLGTCLTALHERELSHGDIKAANVMIRLPKGFEDIHSWEVVILDWGDPRLSTPGRNILLPDDNPFKRDTLGLTFMLCSFLSGPSKNIIDQSGIGETVFDLWTKFFSASQLPQIFLNNSSIKNAHSYEREQRLEQELMQEREREELARQWNDRISDLWDEFNEADFSNPTKIDEFRIANKRLRNQKMVKLSEFDQRHSPPV
eukprot:gnl/Dysnectes_brevis/775_a853_2740.p1 GENE.gnl/Dysnectes_brevis/775_a853_2740~~gnl/Dysnectes_brevis/775_a853_2740.p1  ORF type:complete len:598 (-),score=45.47 gnl/Dysnectes_brevis/775_a853_2740:54-1847(-)